MIMMKAKKNKTILRVILAIFIAVYSSSAVNAANVLYDSSLNEIGIYSENVNSITILNSALNNPALLSHNGRIWYLNASIRMYNTGTFYINNSDVS
jgi:hypothetical protein